MRLQPARCVPDCRSSAATAIVIVSPIVITFRANILIFMCLMWNVMVDGFCYARFVVNAGWIESEFFFSPRAPARRTYIATLSLSLSRSLSLVLAAGAMEGSGIP